MPNPRSTRNPIPMMIASSFALTTLGSLSFAQAAPPAPPAPPAADAPPAAVFDPQQFPAVRGELERLTLTARGDIDGFILTDGTEVKTAPELGSQIAFALKPGDRVTVHGLKAAALPLVRAVSITDENTHRTVTDSNTVANPPLRVPPSPGHPAASAGAITETSGKVRMALHGPQGEVNGVLLESGAILRFPPDQIRQLSAAVQPQQAIIAEGIATTNALGTVIDVQQIGTARDRLVAVGPPLRSIGERGPAGIRRDPPPPALPGHPPVPPAGLAPNPKAPLPPAAPAT